MIPQVHLVEDDDESRKMLAMGIASESYDVAEYATAERFLAKFVFDGATPQCLVTDLRLPGMSGLELQERLRQLNVRMPIMFVTGYADVLSAVAAIKCGAVDFFEKPVDPASLKERIQQVLTGEIAASQAHAKKLKFSERLSKLTAREHQVMELLAAGESTKSIANILGINGKTVFVHRARVLEKLGIDNLVELSRTIHGSKPMDAIRFDVKKRKGPLGDANSGQ
jgi:FixJ family two-component response regulator